MSCVANGGALVGQCHVSVLNMYCRGLYLVLGAPILLHEL